MKNTLAHSHSRSRVPRWWLAGLAACTLTVAVQAQPKIGVVDLDKVFNNYYRTKQALSQLKERAAGFDDDLKTMRKDLDKATEDYSKAVEAANDPALSADEREKRKSVAEKRFLDRRQIEQEIRQFVTTSENTIKEQQRRLFERIFEEIRELVATKAKEKGLTLVIETSGKSLLGAPVLLYHNGENDLSDSILAELNSRTPVEIPGATEKKEEKKKEEKKDSTPPDVK